MPLNYLFKDEYVILCYVPLSCYFQTMLATTIKKGPEFERNEGFKCQNSDL
jgi:hypothetical protein